MEQHDRQYSTLTDTVCYIYIIYTAIYRCCTRRGIIIAWKGLQLLSLLLVF